MRLAAELGCIATWFSKVRRRRGCMVLATPGAKRQTPDYGSPSAHPPGEDRDGVRRSQDSAGGTEPNPTHRRHLCRRWRHAPVDYGQRPDQPHELRQRQWPHRRQRARRWASATMRWTASTASPTVSTAHSPKAPATTRSRARRPSARAAAPPCCTTERLDSFRHPVREFDVITWGGTVSTRPMRRRCRAVAWRSLLLPGMLRSAETGFGRSHSRFVAIRGTGCSNATILDHVPSTMELPP